MTQDTVKAILIAEQQAEDLYAAAQRQADQIVADAEAKVAWVQQEMLEEATRQRQRLVETGKEAADRERARIHAEAHAEADQLEERARAHFDQAVDYVVRRVIGRG